MNKVKLIRGLWGSNEERERLSPYISQSNDIDKIQVYVLGEDNYNYLSKLGYSCVLMNDREYICNSNLEHKLHVCDWALANHSCPIIYLDWDTTLIHDLDANFYQYFASISFPIQLALDICDRDICTWRDEDKRIVPTSNLIYIRDCRVIEEILKIHKDLDLPKNSCKVLMKYIDSLTGKWRGAEYYEKFFEIPFFNTDFTKKIYGKDKDVVYFSRISKMDKVQFYRLPDKFENATSTF